MFTLGEDSIVTTRGNLGHAVARQYVATGRVMGLPDGTIEDFALSAVGAGDVGLAERVMVLALIKQPPNISGVGRLAVALARSPDGRGVIAEALKLSADAPDAEARCAVVLALPREEIAALGELAEPCREPAVRRAVGLLEEGRFDRAFELLGAAETMPASGPGSNETSVALLVAAQEAFVAARSGDLHVLREALKKVDLISPAVSQRVAPQLRRVALAEEARSQRSDPEKLKALLLMADFSSRTTVEHEAVMQLVRSLPGPPERLWFSSPDALELIARYAAKDEAIRSVAAGLFGPRFNGLVSGLTVSAALAQEAERETVRRGELRRLGIGISLTTAALLLTVGLWRACRSRLAVNAGRRWRGFFWKSCEAGASHSGESVECKQLLALFGLPSGASRSEIKAAYRQQIKRTHPDLSAHSDEAAAEECIEVTRRYNRLLALYEERESRKGPAAAA